MKILTKKKKRKKNMYITNIINKKCTCNNITLNTKIQKY